MPADVRVGATEQDRLEVLLRRLNLEPEHYCEGHLQRLLSEQNNFHEHGEHYAQARTVLDRMAARVAPMATATWSTGSKERFVMKPTVLSWFLHGHPGLH
ncbi:hypothetical protein [Streptomyces chartreusis]|uniref:hypothetical protein n=1 Tax=Streptomyces chartreusis TaxID=1969 RepID=UPI0036422F55